MMGYSALVNGIIAVLFKLNRGMSIIGKDPKTGEIPIWSYIVFYPFHFPSMLYTYVHTRIGTEKLKTPSGETKRERVPVASEVQPGWWVGGCYANELDKDWAGIIDQTVEFPESCINRTQGYLLLPTWDGVPATPEQLEEAATFAIEARKHGDVLVHCAHGRGRSTTVMCACLVKAGLFPTWQEAFEYGVKPNRPVCKLNSIMRRNLTKWQEKYVDGKKTQ
jgi:protein-tyrosine phosphatase